MKTESIRVLVVDDEVSLTRMLKLNLERGGEFTIREINTANEARAEAKRFKPNVILLDVMMPEVDGGQLAAQFQQDPELKHVPIVFLTAAVKKSEVVARNGIIGGLPFLAKPVELRQLKECLQRQLAEPRLAAMRDASTGGKSTPVARA